MKSRHPEELCGGAMENETCRFVVCEYLLDEDYQLVSVGDHREINKVAFRHKETRVDSEHRRPLCKFKNLHILYHIKRSKSLEYSI